MSTAVRPPRPGPGAAAGPVEPAAAPAPPRRRLRSALAAVPRPLAALLVAVAIAGVAWALLQPPFQAVDEISHFAYVQSLVERGALPGNGPQPYSTAQSDVQFALNHENVRVFPPAKPEWSRVGYQAWLARAAHDPENDGGGPTTASGYPPAYYLVESLGYRLGGGHDVVSQLYAARLLSVVWLLITTTATWLLAGELLGRRRLLQLVAAAAVGLWPMIDAISSGVNPDAMLYAVWTLALWLGVRIIRRGLTPGRAAVFAGCVGLALVTKATSLALLPAAAFVLGYGLWRGRRVALRRSAVTLAVAAVAIGAPVAAWEAVTSAQNRPAYGQAAAVTTSATGSHQDVRTFLSYLWQFYLPRLPFQHPVHYEIPTVSTYPAYNVWVATSWAAFGWINVYFPLWAYPLFLAITVAVMLGGASRLALVLRRWRGPPRLPPRTLPVAGFLALATVALLLGLHWTEFRNGYATNHGQYLFPLASLAGITLAAATALAPRRWRPAAAGVVLGTLAVYELFCLGLVAARFYGLAT